MGIWASENSGGGTTTVISGSTYPGHIPVINDWAAFIATTPNIVYGDIVNYAGYLFRAYEDGYSADDPTIDTVRWGPPLLATGGSWING